MARIKMLEKAEVEAEAIEIYQKAEDSTGKVINLFKILAHSPKTLRDWNRLGTTILMKGVLSPKLRELAIVRVGELAQAQYELTAHRRIGMETGLTQVQIDDVAAWEGSSNFDEQERAVLRYTDEVTLNIKASDEAYAAIEKHFSPKEIVELTVAIGYYGMVCRFLETLQVDPEA
ncbi:MAG: carboxymuconolactone decarboxylase family protein [Proteobacteria bacterium]|nr:carboxymuconolactone decarboxylase family protein [Pseudomonadota bacterium]